MSPSTRYDPELEFRVARWTECPHCRNYVKFLFALAEKSVECPHCWQQFVMPALPPLVARRFRRTDENRGFRIAWLCISAFFVAVGIYAYFEGYAVAAAGIGVAGSLWCVALLTWLPPKRTARQRLLLASKATQPPLWLTALTVAVMMLPSAPLIVVGGRLFPDPPLRSVAMVSSLLLGYGLGGIGVSWLQRWHAGRRVRQFLQEMSQRGMSPDGLMRHCIACGYEPLAGPVDWCPECGTSFRPFGELSQTLQEMKLDPHRVLRS